MSEETSDHMRELAAYRLTVENLQREIAALSAQPAATPSGAATDPYSRALEIRVAQGWQLKGDRVPVLYTDTINGDGVGRDDLWLCTTSALAFHGQAPAQPANTKTHDLLSTMIGMFLGFKEKIGYKTGSAIDKTVAEAVEHLKDWPYPGPAPSPQAAQQAPRDAERELEMTQQFNAGRQYEAERIAARNAAAQQAPAGATAWRSAVLDLIDECPGLTMEQDHWLSRRVKELDLASAPVAQQVDASPSAASIAWNALRDATDPLGELGAQIMGHIRVFAQRQYEAGLAEGRADSVAQQVEGGDAEDAPATGMNDPLDALRWGANVAETLLGIGRSIGFGRAQQILGEQWEAEHNCAPRGRMGVTVGKCNPPKLWTQRSQDAYRRGWSDRAAIDEAPAEKKEGA